MNDPDVGPNQFRCEYCGRVFDKSEPGEAEMEAKAKGFDPDQCDLVCDGCYAEYLDRWEASWEEA